MYVAYVVFTLCVVLSNDKFHVRLSHDRITDLRNDINMYVYMYVCKWWLPYVNTGSQQFRLVGC